MAREGIWIITGPEWRRTGIALREVDSSLPSKFRSDLRRVVRPFAEEVKARVRALPTHGHKHTGLRRRIARGVGIQAGFGTGVRITTSMPTPSEAIIPRGMDSQTPSKGWHHPVFGRGSVFQKGYSWFTEPLQDKRDDVGRSLTDVLEDARDTIARAS